MQANSANRSSVVKRQAAPEGEVDRVYRVLKDCFLECEFRPGDFLAEADLARHCSTSRTPIREACNRLSQEKWIARIRNRGFVIPSISVGEIVDVYEYRKLLECFTVERAAQASSAEQIAELKRITQVENKARHEIKELLDANEAFHLRIADLAGNKHIVDHLRRVLEYVRRLD